MMRKHIERQQGVALVMALLFLVIITLLALNSMRTSTLELKMSGNEQLRLEAVQSAQSAVDGVLATDNFPVQSQGYTICFNKSTAADGTACNVPDKTLTGDAYSPATNQVEIRLENAGSFTCRACASSAAVFQGALFSIRSDYHDTTRGTRAQVDQGLLMLIPTGN